MKNPKKPTLEFLLSCIIPFIITGALCIFINNLPQKVQPEQAKSIEYIITPETNPEELTFQSLKGYAYFISLVLVIYIFLLAYKTFANPNLANNHPNDQNESSMSKKKLSFGILGRMATRVLRYTLAYSLWRVIWLFIGSSGFSLDISMLTASSSLLQEEFQGSSSQTPHHFYQEESLMRVLEEEYLPMMPKSSENSMASLSLAVGKVLSSLSIEAYDIVLSKDENTAFVSVKAARTVHIIDITGFQSPLIIKTIVLPYIDLTYSLRSLKLSSDEKYLFASTFQFLEIIDVTNLESPKILAQIQDRKAWSDHFSQFSGIVPSFYRISMAFSSDENTLFVAGLGLQIFDIKNKSNPALLNTTLPGDPNFYLPATSLDVSQDGKTLFYTDGTLNIFDISENPQTPKWLSSYSCLASIKSISSIKRTEMAFVTCLDEEKYTMIQKLDLSNPLEPKTLKSYNLGIQVSSSLMILTMTSQASHLFLSMDFAVSKSPLSGSYQKLFVYDLIQEELLDNNKSLLPKVTSLIFSKDNQNIFAAGQSQFLIFELHLRYPNTETFSLTNKPISQVDLQEEAIMFELSLDNQFLLTIDDTHLSSPSQLRLYNLSNTLSPSLFLSFDFGQPVNLAKLSSDQKRLYVFFQRSLAIFELVNGSSLSKVGLFENLQEIYALNFAATLNGKTGFVLKNLYQNVYIMGSFDFTNLPEISYFKEQNEIGAERGLSKMLISKDDQVLMVISPTISIFNISDPEKITKLSSTPLIYDGATPIIGSCKLSADEKVLLIISIDGNLYKLRIYEMEKIDSPKFQSEFILPRLSTKAVYAAPPIFSSDMKRVYILLKQSLLMLDISDLKKPQIAGVIPLTSADNEEFSHFAISSDYKLVFVKNSQHVVKTFSLETPYTLFLHKETFPLGLKYTDEVIFFKLGGAKNNRYLPMDQGEYRVLKVTTLDIKIVANEDSPQMVGAHFPYWMSFDKENSMINIEPKQQRDLGIYTLLTAFSNRVPIGSFQDILVEKNMTTTSTVEDLVTTLISLGYLDNQLFLTKNFGSLENFFLTSQFLSVRNQVYNVLKSHYIETCTSFNTIIVKRSTVLESQENFVLVVFCRETQNIEKS